MERAADSNRRARNVSCINYKPGPPSDRAGFAGIFDWIIFLGAELGVSRVSMEMCACRGDGVIGVELYGDCGSLCKIKRTFL